MRDTEIERAWESLRERESVRETERERERERERQTDRQRDRERQRWWVGGRRGTKQKGNAEFQTIFVPLQDHLSYLTLIDQPSFQRLKEIKKFNYTA